MNITLLGIVVLPLSLIWALRPVRLLQSALLLAVFEAAAALVFGGFGLQPTMVPGLMFVVYVAAQYALGMRYAGEAVALATLLPLLALVGYAVLSVYLLPDAFAGRVMVWPQKVDPLDPGIVPLRFTFGNVTQSLYLAINAAFAVSVAIFVTRDAIPYRGLIAAYLLGGYVVVVLVFWQFANRMAGVPYPEDLLHSNPGWAIVDQMLGSVPRMQGPFSEPAALAAYLSGLCFCCMWLCIRGYQVMRPNLLLALSLVCMLLSTSTTGIVILATGLPLVVLVGSAGGDPGALGRIGRTMGMLVLGGMLVIGPVLILKPALLEAVNTVVESTMTKGQSASYDERTGMDTAALDTLGATWGLGVGWGSFRSSSLIPGLVANGGAFGVAMVAWLVLRIMRLGRRGRAAAPDHPGQVLVDGFSAALCGQLAAALLSAPMIVSQAFFLQLGCVVGVLARMTLAPRPAAAGTRAAGPPPAWDAPRG
jgi:hypothetical protein